MGRSPSAERVAVLKKKPKTKMMSRLSEFIDPPLWVEKKIDEHLTINRPQTTGKFCRAMKIEGLAHCCRNDSYHGQSNNMIENRKVVQFLVPNAPEAVKELSKSG